MRTEEFVFNGHTATVIIPDKPNGKWIWKTEFLYAFDQAEQKLNQMGYTRVYYSISHKYGSYQAVRLMRKFYHHVVEKYSLDKKAYLFGFSRGGLYAFNFALFYPEYVAKVYLDAPVLDMNDWPPKDSNERQQVYEEYCLTEKTLENFNGNPINNLDEFFSLNIPLMIVAGGSDEVVHYDKNSQIVIEYCKKNNIDLVYFVKPECMHHPHSLEDVKPIIDFIEK